MNESISELQHRLMLEASGRFEDRVDLMRLYEQRGGASLWKAAIEARQLGYADVAKGCALEGLELAFVKRGHALEQLYGSDGVARCAQEDIPFFGGLNKDVTMYVGRFVTLLSLISDDTNDFGLQKRTLEIMLSPEYLESQLAEQTRLPIGIALTAHRAAKQTLEMFKDKNTLMLYRIGKLNPHLSKDTYRLDLLDRLPGFR